MGRNTRKTTDGDMKQPMHNTAPKKEITKLQGPRRAMRLVINPIAHRFIKGVSYKGKNEIILNVLLPFWQKVLYAKGWVASPTMEALRKSMLVAYSPIKTLSLEQEKVLNSIVDNPSKSFVINGDAGTGKTVLLTHLVVALLSSKRKIAIVLQRNWIKMAESIFKLYEMKHDNLTIATSSMLINSEEKYDVIIVDEAHKLSRKYPKQMPSFNAVYDIDKRFNNCNNHLEILQKMGEQIILMYDLFQAIRPANITRAQFAHSTNGYEKKYLKTQFRIKSSTGKQYSSDDYINGIKYFLYKDTGMLNSLNFNINFSRDVFMDQSETAYFGYIKENPLHGLFEWIESDRHLHPENVNRVLGGLVEPWKQSDGKCAEKLHWHEGNLHKRWNSTQENWLNSDDIDAENQIGSVFGVQGMDLNKVGVLIGDDLQVDPEGKLYGSPENFHNVNGKFSKKDMDPKEFTLFVLNIYYVLLTRGIDGIRIGFWRNDKLKDYFEKTLLK